MQLSRFEQFWLAEHQRLRDVRDPSLQQQQFKLTELQQDSRQQRLLQRAVGLSERRGLISQLQHWQHLRRLLTLLFGLIAVLAGVAVTQAILGQPQPISLLFAVNTLLLPNLVMFLFWVLFSLRRSQPTGVTGLAYSLLTLIQRKRDDGLLSESWLRHAQQQRLLQPLIALASHGFWLLLALSSWLSLLLYLSFNDYSFHWATTILSNEQVYAIASALNVVPELVFGTQLPGTSAQGNYLTVASEAGRWLTLCLLTYGVLPRGIAALLSALLYYRRLRAMQIDTQAEGTINIVRAIEQGEHATTTVDADASTDSDPLRFDYAAHGEGSLLLSLDYDPEPPHATTAENLGVVATYTEKQQMLARLQATPSSQLQVRVAAQLTPDRSSLRYLAALAATTQKLTVVLVRGAQPTYLQQWQRQLDKYGVDHVVA